MSPFFLIRRVVSSVSLQSTQYAQVPSIRLEIILRQPLFPYIRGQTPKKDKNPFSKGPKEHTTHRFSDIVARYATG